METLMRYLTASGTYCLRFCSVDLSHPALIDYEKCAEHLAHQEAPSLMPIDSGCTHACSRPIYPWHDNWPN